MGDSYCADSLSHVCHHEASFLAFSIRSRGVTVSTLDSESSDRGSNPRETYLSTVGRCRFSMVCGEGSLLQASWYPHDSVRKFRGLQMTRAQTLSARHSLAGDSVPFLVKKSPHAGKESSMPNT